MKTLTRIAFFLLTLLIGIQTTAVLSNIIAGFRIPDPIEVADDEDVVQQRAETVKGVRIIYSHMQNTSAQSVDLVFVVINGTSGPLTYRGFGEQESIPYVRVGAEEVNTSCFFRVTERPIVIPAGGSTEITLSNHSFSRVPGKFEETRIGFRLHPSEIASPMEYYSQPMVLPKEFREAIKRSLR